MAAVGSVLVSSLLLLTSAGSAVAASKISIELNRLQQIDNGCRMNLVFTNGLPTQIGVLTMEAVLFDKEERVDRFLLFRTRDLPPGKIRVHQFDVSGASCGDIGRVLLNDVTECEGEGLSPAACLRDIELSSRAEASFVSSISPAAESGAQTRPDGAAAGAAPDSAERTE